jgi:hypothetical protein
LCSLMARNSSLLSSPPCPPHRFRNYLDSICVRDPNRPPRWSPRQFISPRERTIWKVWLCSRRLRDPEPSVDRQTTPRLRRKAMIRQQMRPSLPHPERATHIPFPRRPLLTNLVSKLIKLNLQQFPSVNRLLLPMLSWKRWCSHARDLPHFVARYW